MPNNNENITISYDSIYIGSDFYGEYSKSPNEKYIIAWCDAKFYLEKETTISKPGRVILIEDNIIIFSKVLRRPNYGCVANNGTCIICDIDFDIVDTKSKFYAYDNKGNIIIDNYFNALPFNASISSNGLYCICQLCNSDYDDGGTLNMFNLSTQKKSFAIIPAVGWANTYEFDLEKRILYLLYKDKGRYAYQFDGTFLDSSKWEIERIEYLNGFELSAMARRKLNQLNGSITQINATEILTLAEKALKRNLDNYPNEKAKVYRTMGEVYEIIKDLSNTIKYYELALNTNPKIGLKRKLENLKEKQT